MDSFEKRTKLVGDCLIWIGPKKSAYGGHKGRLAHRVAYERANGDIPEGMMVLHTCDNPLCVNPKHLFLGTQIDNIADAMRKDRLARGEKQGLSKLTWEKVRAIRVEYESTITSQPILARKYGVSQGTIYQVVNKKTWKETGARSELAEGQDK